MQIPLIGRGLQGRHLRTAPSLLINAYPEIHQGKLSDASIIGCPGLKLFADLGASPTRFVTEVNGVLYVLAGDTFYSVDSNGNASAASGATIPGSFSPKGDDNGLQIVMPIGASSYLYTIATDTVAQITDPDLGESSSCAFIGQYIAFIKDSTGQFILSDALDASSIDALNFATGESDPDINIANHAFQGNHWLFGTKTTEVWYVSGEAFPLNPYNDGSWPVGCGARLSVASNEDYIIWVTPNRRVYLSTGGKPLPISTPEVEYQLSLLSTISDGDAFIYTEEGHTFYQVSFADLTLCYDLTTQWWFEKKSDYGRHFAAKHVYVYGKNIVSDYRNGKLYEMAMDYGTDNGEPVIMEGILPPTGAINGIEFTSEQGITPLSDAEQQLELRWSRDGRNWGNWAAENSGEEGEYLTRTKWDSLPKYRTLYLHWRTNVDASYRLIRADA